MKGSYKGYEYIIGRDPYGVFYTIYGTQYMLMSARSIADAICKVEAAIDERAG